MEREKKRILDHRSPFAFRASYNNCIIIKIIAFVSLNSKYDYLSKFFSKVK